jgi:hypothetical protein
MLGRVIASREVKVAEDTDTAIDVVEWAAGAYLLEIQMGSQFITKRVMIDRN